MILSGRYEVIGVLGKGGGGTVYKVKQAGTERILAVKEMKISEERRKDWTEKENEIMKNCFHPGIPVVLESFRNRDFYYMVTEFVEGVTLKKYVEKRGKLSVEEALDIGWKLSEIICYLHSRNQPVIHGDLKPENIMITEQGDLRLIDFGSACTEDTERKGCFATAGYASAQQLKGHRLKVTDDIFGFGAVLHFLLTGEDPELPPYRRRKLRECDRSFSVNLEKFIQKCLAVQEKKRFQTMEAVQQSMKKYQRKEKVKYLLRMAERVFYAGVWILISILYGRAFKNWREGVLPAENRALRTGIFLGALILIMKSVRFVKGTGEKNGYRLEKKVWKTHKKSAVLLLCLFFFTAGSLNFPSAAHEKDSGFPVTIYSQSGYKVCLKDGSVYDLQGNFRIEIPEKCFETEKVRTVTVTISNENGEIKSMYQVPVRLWKK